LDAFRVCAFRTFFFLVWSSGGVDSRGMIFSRPGLPPNAVPSYRRLAPLCLWRPQPGVSRIGRRLSITFPCHFLSRGSRDFPYEVSLQRRKEESWEPTSRGNTSGSVPRLVVFLITIFPVLAVLRSFCLPRETFKYRD